MKMSLKSNSSPAAVREMGEREREKREGGRERKRETEREGGAGEEDDRGGEGGNTCGRTVLGKQPVNQRDSNLAMDCPTLLPNS